MERALKSLLNLLSPRKSFEKASDHSVPCIDARFARWKRNKSFAHLQVAGRDRSSAREGQFHRRLSDEPIGGTWRRRCPAPRLQCVPPPPLPVLTEATAARSSSLPVSRMTYGNDGALKGMVEFEAMLISIAQKNAWFALPSTLGKICVRKSRRSSRIVAEFSREIPELLAPLRFTEKLHSSIAASTTLNATGNVRGHYLTAATTCRMRIRTEQA